VSNEHSARRAVLNALPSQYYGRIAAMLDGQLGATSHDWLLALNRNPLKLAEDDVIWPLLFRAVQIAYFQDAALAGTGNSAAGASTLQQVPMPSTSAGVMAHLQQQQHQQQQVLAQFAAQAREAQQAEALKRRRDSQDFRGQDQSLQAMVARMGRPSDTEHMRSTMQVPAAPARSGEMKHQTQNQPFGTVGPIENAQHQMMAHLVRSFVLSEWVM